MTIEDPKHGQPCDTTPTGVADGAVVDARDDAPGTCAAGVSAPSAPPESSAADPPTDETDHQLMRRITDRDESAFEMLFDRYRRAVYAICLRVLGNETDAEEALLTVFWEVWNQPARFDLRRGTVWAYLMMLSRSRAIDHYRSRAARGRSGNAASPLDPDDQRTSAAGEDDPAELFWLAQRREQVRDALRTLMPDQHEAIVLSFFEGKSHQEIADRLNTPLGTIKTRIRLGLIRLRDTLRTLKEESPR